MLPVAGKIYETILYNNTYEFFTEYNLMSPNQSGFKPDDSCINQLLSIAHEIYKSFDDGLEVRGRFQENSLICYYRLFKPGYLKGKYLDHRCF